VDNPTQMTIHLDVSGEYTVTVRVAEEARGHVEVTYKLGRTTLFAAYEFASKIGWLKEPPEVRAL
jgi:hypothetical protein